MIKQSFMKGLAFGAGLVLAVIALIAAQEGKDRVSPQQVREGKQKFLKSCRSCHFVPDPAIRTDKIWLEMLYTTA